MERLEGGLEKLKSTAAQVDDLKEKLAAQEVELKQKNEDADALIQKVGVEQEKVGKEKEFADGEEKKVAKINEEVSKKQKDCETDLARAEPALQAAADALNTLNKANLTELKSFGKPPPIVVKVVAAVMVLTSPPNKISKDRSWNTGKNYMGKVDQFLDSLLHFDKENIQPSNLHEVRPYLQDKEFEPDFVRNKSFAASGESRGMHIRAWLHLCGCMCAHFITVSSILLSITAAFKLSLCFSACLGLCSWAINIVKFYEVFCDVEPKRKALATANAELALARDKLAKIKAKIKELDDNLAKLTQEFEEATAAKLKCQQEAEATASTISLANR